VQADREWTGRRVHWQMGDTRIPREEPPLQEVALGKRESLKGSEDHEGKGMSAKTLEAHPATGEGQEGCGEDQRTASASV
jgi:hypothetical protein